MLFEILLIILLVVIFVAGFLSFVIGLLIRKAWKDQDRALVYVLTGVTMMLLASLVDYCIF